MGTRLSKPRKFLSSSSSAFTGFNLLGSDNWLRTLLWLLSLVLVGAGARLWLIHRFGTALPFWDQWDLARYIYVPYLEGKLTLADLLRPHAENRIVISRLFGLGLLLLNGKEFDNHVEMAGNVFLYTFTMAVFAWLL